MQLTIVTNPEFDFDLLPQFAEDHGVTYSIGWDEGYTVTFRSSNRDQLEEVRDQLLQAGLRSPEDEFLDDLDDDDEFLELD